MARSSGPADALSPMAHTDAALQPQRASGSPRRRSARRPSGPTWLRWPRRSVAVTPPGDTYVNFLDLDGATPERIRAAYSADDWDRLVRLKARYDPNNVFRFNRNIPLGPRPIRPTASEHDR